MAGSRRLSPDFDSAVRSVDGLRCLIALSGGPDSAALAWLCSTTAASARAIHVDHGTEHSAAMATAAKAVAGRLGLELEVVSVDIPPEGASWEDKARRARYEALRSRRQAGEVIVTGHTADDSAETMLMNLGRGSGAFGLSGIPERREDVLRPLLGVRRSNVRALATSVELPFVDDPSNVDAGATRNRIRHRLMAEYEKALGRDPVPGLMRSATHLRATTGVIGLQADQVPYAIQDGVARVARARLAVEPAPIAVEVIRRMVQAVLPPHPPSTAEVERVMSVSVGAQSTTELEGGVVATTSRANLLVGPPPAPISDRYWDSETVAFGGWTLRQRSTATQPPPGLTTTMRCVVPASGQEIVVRMVRPDDVFSIRRGTKRAQAAIAEAGIAAVARSLHPVVTVGGELVWIPGVRAVVAGWEERGANGYLLLDVVEEGPWK